MSNIILLLRKVHSNVHVFNMKLKYSEPKIYTGGVDIHQWSKLSATAKKAALDKDWYVYFSFRDPETGILKRQTNIKAGANSYKEMKKRIAHLRTIQRNLFLLLEAGFDPYGDNTELEMAFMGNTPSTGIVEKAAPVKTMEPVPLGQPIRPVVPKTPTPDFLKAQPLPTQPIPPAPIVKPVQVPAPTLSAPAATEIETETVTVREAFELALNTKRNVLNDNSYIKYKSRINRYLKWLEEKSLADGPILDIKKKTVILYLNEVLDNSSARNRNNTRTALSSLFQVLENNEIIPENFIKKINVLKSTPTRNKTYTPSMEREIDIYLKEKDPLLRLFIQFICFNFLRPIEVCRLKIQDLDLQDGKIYVKAKNSPVKIKIIPEILLKQLPDLSKKRKGHFLFTPQGIGGEWTASENDKRNYFSHRFKKVKDHFGMGTDYGLYSFRHTFITKLYREMAKKESPMVVKSKLMLITGHSTITALDKYLRDIDAALPDDYSHLFDSINKSADKT